MYNMFAMYYYLPTNNAACDSIFVVVHVASNRSDPFCHLTMAVRQLNLKIETKLNQNQLRKAKVDLHVAFV